MCFSPIANPSMKFLVTAEDPVTIMIDLRCGIPKGIYREKDYIAPQKRDIDESIQWSNIEIIEQSYAAVTVNKSRLSFNSFAELLVNNIFQYRCVENSSAFFKPAYTPLHERSYISISVY